MRKPSMLRHALAATSLTLLALWASAPGPATAAGAGGDIQSADDLLQVCADPADASAIACKFYVLGALQSAAIMHAADSGRANAPLYCASDTTTTGDLITAVRALVAAHPDRRTYPAASVVVGGAMEAYPCKRTPAPLHRRRRAKRHG